MSRVLNAGAVADARRQRVRQVTLRPALPLALCLLAGCAQAARAQELAVTLVGNAGVMLSDGATSLLVDLPHEPGAFGYISWDPAALEPVGDVVSVITHHHRDHFDPSLFLPRASWRIIGPPSVTAELPAQRVLAGDSVTVGAFAIIAIPTPHTPDHRSYRIRWHGRLLHFTGDTDDVAALPLEPRLDVLFITPWLQCAVEESGRGPAWDRSILYHRRADGADRLCGTAEPLEPGSSFTLPAR